MSVREGLALLAAPRDDAGLEERDVLIEAEGESSELSRFEALWDEWLSGFRGQMEKLEAELEVALALPASTEAIRECARIARIGLLMQNEAAERTLRAQRSAGALLAEIEAEEQGVGG